jgi:lipase
MNSTVDLGVHSKVKADLTPVQTEDVPVEGGLMRVLRFGDGPNIIVAAHGITGSGMSYPAVGRHLPDGWTLLALDMRGRGASRDLPAPYGYDQHIRDLHAVIEHYGAPVVLTGHSMGAYVALLAAAARPDLASRLVLIDGGPARPVPPEVDPDDFLALTIGPALTRLSMTFESAQAYVDFFRAHPAMGPHWNDDIENYVRYDLTGPAGALRSRAVEAAVRQDGRDVLAKVPDLIKAATEPSMPTLLLYAPAGMMGQPPGFLPAELIQEFLALAPAIRAEQVPDTNHYTILFSPDAAALVARRLTDPASWPGEA